MEGGMTTFPLQTVCCGLAILQDSRGMLPSLIQHQAIEARLNCFLGAKEYDRLCLGMTIGPLEHQVLYVYAVDDAKASELQEEYSAQITISAESAMRSPVSAVRVLPFSFNTYVWAGEPPENEA